MAYGSICCFICIYVAVVVGVVSGESDLIADSGTDVQVYRVRTHHPFEEFRHESPGVAANIEELIMANDYKRAFFRPESQTGSWEETYEAAAYYEMPQKDLCKENNGNCSQKCETVGGQPICSCSEGFTLTGITDCSAISTCDIVLSGTSGEFDLKRGPCQWTIKAPANHTIKLTISVNQIHYGYEIPYIMVYDGNSSKGNAISLARPREGENVFRSSGPDLVIFTENENAWYYRRARGSYVTGFYTLNGSGSLDIPLSETPEEELCLSLTYSVPQQDDHFYSAHLKPEEIIYPQFSFTHHGGHWKRDIFRIPHDQERKLLQFQFLRGHWNVLNLGRCLNLEYHAAGGHLTDGHNTVCRNGGLWSDRTESCVCPQGFFGAYCEEGCGPNRYGENCTEICSFLSSACEGMIFCTEELCSCAPGLQGTNCDLPCNPGTYGASCQQYCGNCVDNKSCDRYTGKCYSGCATGFYPPFCQQTYKVLTKEPDIVAVSYNSLKIRVSFKNVSGEGQPTFYEIQYKEEKEELWSELSPRTISDETEFDINGLFPGKYYEIRVILIDEDGGSNQIEVPKSKAITKCLEPHETNYHFAVKDIRESDVTLEWSYKHDKTSLVCEIVEFELSAVCGGEQFVFPIKEKEGLKRLSGLVPDMSYSFLLTGIAITGRRTLPAEITVHTIPAIPGRVRNVKAMPLESGSKLNVTWVSPWNSQPETLQYKVSYKCLRLLACKSVSCSTVSGDVEVSTTSAILDHLQPHALYKIEVAAVSVDGVISEGYVISATTAHAAPLVPPSSAEDPVLAVTNTSASLNWMPPENCSAVNGYIYGYSYVLIDNDTQEVIRQGTVPENILSFNFSGLMPTHCYDGHIMVVSSGGASLSSRLIIPFCTRSTAPDQVQSLSVYKRSRRMVGLRWSLPLNTYGDIKSFTIEYSKAGSGHKKKLVIEPEHCGAWVELYCHTVSGLSPGKKYDFVVQARNKEVDVDGEPTSVEAITAEGASTPPVNLKIINATESSMLVEWGLPDNVNGQLRSFIIIVEQIDMIGKSEECCDEIPLQDYRVSSEQPLYHYEITDLSAASTYSVIVSAKTVTLGEESRVIGHTYPPKLSLSQDALTVVETEDESNDSDMVTLQIQPVQDASGINRTYILLLLSNISSTQQSLETNEWTALLQSRFTENYHLLSEYTQEEAENQPVVTFNLKDLGLLSTETQTRKYALVVVQDYMGNQNVDVFVTGEMGA